MDGGLVTPPGRAYKVRDRKGRRKGGGGQKRRWRERNELTAPVGANDVDQTEQVHGSINTPQMSRFSLVPYTVSYMMDWIRFRVL